MKKIVAMLVMCTTASQATLPVVDYAGNIQNEINAVAAYIRQGLQYAQDQATTIATQTTALRELQQCENEILALSRYGDPKLYIQLPGISNLTTLESIVQQFQQDVTDLTAIASGKTVGSSYAQILSQYGQSAFTGYTSGWGVTISPTQGMIQFGQSSFSVAQATQVKLQTLNSEKQALTAQRDQSVASEAAATDTETRTRYHNQAMSLSAAISETNAAIQQAIQESNIQQQQIQAARGLYQTSNNLQTQAAFQQNMETGVTQMGGPTGTITTTGSEFGYVDNPAIGGGGDPGTSGNWYTGAGGQYIGGVNSTGISLPAATEISQFGSIQSAQNQPVTITDLSTGLSVQTTIVDVGPGQSRAAQGIGVDLTHGTAVAVGMKNGSDPMQVSFGSNSPN